MLRFLFPCNIRVRLSTSLIMHGWISICISSGLTRKATGFETLHCIYAWSGVRVLARKTMANFFYVVFLSQISSKIWSLFPFEFQSFSKNILILFVIHVCIHKIWFPWDHVTKWHGNWIFKVLPQYLKFSNGFGLARHRANIHHKCRNILI